MALASFHNLTVTVLKLVPDRGFYGIEGNKITGILGRNTDHLLVHKNKR